MSVIDKGDKLRAEIRGTEPGIQVSTTKFYIPGGAEGLGLRTDAFRVGGSALNMRNTLFGGRGLNRQGPRIRAQDQARHHNEYYDQTRN